MWVLIHGHAKIPNSPPGSKVKVKHEWHIARAHFVHFGALKIHLLLILETHFQGTGLRANSFSAFWRLKMRFLPSRETHATRVRSFVWTHFLLYGDLKMWVLINGQAKKGNSRPGSKVKIKHELNIARAHFVHFGALKIYFLPSLQTHVKGYERHIALAHFVHLGALKIHLLPSLETHVQGYLDSCELFFFILELENVIFSDSWNPCLRVSSFVWTHFLLYGDLKISFCFTV